MLILFDDGFYKTFDSKVKPERKNLRSSFDLFIWCVKPIKKHVTTFRSYHKQFFEQKKFQIWINWSDLTKKIKLVARYIFRQKGVWVRPGVMHRYVIFAQICYSTQICNYFARIKIAIEDEPSKLFQFCFDFLKD